MEDPRGPMRKAVNIERTSTGVLITKDCGHVGEHNQTFSYKVGEDIRCFECGPKGLEKRLAEHQQTIAERYANEPPDREDSYDDLVREQEETVRAAEGYRNPPW